MRYVFLLVALLVLSIIGLSTGHSSSIGSRANAEHLKIGRFLYRTLVNGKDAGTGEISISKSGQDSFILATHISGAFAQQWESVATAMFAPVSAKVSFGEGDKLQRRFEINYRDGRATGWRLERSTTRRSTSTFKFNPTRSIRESIGLRRWRRNWVRDRSSCFQFLIPLHKSVM
jgi:hypothetical protein